MINHLFANAKGGHACDHCFALASEHETLLCQLARKHETDKGGSHLRYAGGDSNTCHNYTPIYDSYLGEDRYHILHVLEIGINGGSSLRMWKEYFPHAHIVGLDSNAQALIHSEHRIMCLPADQNNPTSLCEAMAKLNPRMPRFDLIVDDGSHELEHQIVSMHTLLPFLADEGYYFIEDVGKEFPDELISAVPEGYYVQPETVYGGIGEFVNPFEYLVAIRRYAHE